MNGLFLNLLRTTLVIGAASIILTLLTPLWNRRYGAIWKKRMWCLLAALALLGVFVHLPGGAAVEVPVPERQVMVTSGADLKSPQVSLANPDTLPSREEIQPGPGIYTSNGTAASGTAEAAPSVSLLFVGELLWALGALLFVLYLIIGEALFRRRLRRWAKPVRSEALTALYWRLCADASKARAPALLVCPGIGSPMLTGLLRPTLLLPHEDYSETDATYILRHELTHWHSRDLFLKALLLAANAVHWFNPAVWLLRREAGREIERACDERVMAGADLEERRAYSAVLLSSAHRDLKPALSTHFTGGKKAMKARLRSILEGKKRGGAALAAAAVILTSCTVPLVSCTQNTSDGRNDAALKQYFQAHYSEEDDGCVYADLTHDGIDEMVVVELWKDIERKEPLSVRDPELTADEFGAGTVSVFHADTGKTVSLIWTGDIVSPHAGWGEYHLCRQEGKDFLLYYNPYQSTGSAYYQYRLFYLGEDGKEQVTAQDEVSCPAYDPADESLTADGLVRRAAPDFLSTVSAYLQQATPLLCFDEAGTGLAAGLAAYSGLYAKFGGETVGPAEVQGDWQTAQLTVEEGVPYIRYGTSADWTKLGEAIAPPREWKDDDLAGRNTAKTLDYDPEISVGLVTAQCGWLVVTYGRGVAAADTYVYRTEDGGKTWTETPAAPDTSWHLAATDFIDPQRAMVAGANFNGAPVFYTADGGATWREETLPFSAKPYWEAASFRNAEDSVYMMAAYGTRDIGRAVFHPKSETWETVYQVSLRDNGETLDVLLEQGGTSSVVCTLRKGQDYQKPEDVSLRPFDGPLGQSGFRLDLHSNNSWWRGYYAVRDTADGGGALQIADSFGGDETDIAEDLDGDGQAELICNVTYNADGVRDVWVYRMKDGVSQVASVKDAMLNIPGNAQLVHPASATYDVSTGSVTLEYLLAGEDDWRIETAPIDYSSLQFEDFTATW